MGEVSRRSLGRGQRGPDPGPWQREPGGAGGLEEHSGGGPTGCHLHLGAEDKSLERYLHSWVAQCHLFFQLTSR